MKKTLIIAVGCLAGSLSLQAHAALPTFDPAALAEAMAGNIERAKEHMEEINWKKNRLKFDTDVAQDQIDTMNNGFANMISRITQGQSDLYNMDKMQEASPALSACNTVTIQALGTQNLCSTAKTAEASTKRHIYRHATQGLSREDQDAIKVITQEEHYDTCKALTGEEQEASKCADGSNFIGNISNLTRTDEDQEAANRFVDYIVGISPDAKAHIPDPENMTYSDKIRYNMEQEREAYRSLVAASMEAVNAERRSPDPTQELPSPLHQMHLFNDDRYGDEVWMRQVLNTPAEGEAKNAMMETQLKRESVAMQAFQLDLQLKQYEQNLRIEALLSGMLKQMMDE